MARVRNIELFLNNQENNNSFRSEENFAMVRFTAEFSPFELRRKMNYRLEIGLFRTPESEFYRQARGNDVYQTFFMPQRAPRYDRHPEWERRMGLATWVSREQFDPNNMQTHHVERRAFLDWRKMEQYNGEFRAFVWLQPEMQEANAFSNAIMRNRRMARMND